MKKLALALILSASLFLVQACLRDPLSVSGGGGMEIRLHVTGGLAGTDYSILLDGDDGFLVGESCINLCDFDQGEVLQVLAREQVDYIWTLFEEANIHGLDGEDFGTECCDQFHFDLRYSDARGVSEVKGSSEALPQELKVAVGTLQGLASGTLPIIVDFNTTRDSWPEDPFHTEDATVSGHTLNLRLSYGGGCRSHDVKVVAWGGWMESDPVQIKLFISHEDFDDPCDAWLTKDYRLDLLPLKFAYEKSYGVAEPGSTTLILLLAEPMISSLSTRILEYQF